MLARLVPGPAPGGLPALAQPLGGGRHPGARRGDWARGAGFLGPVLWLNLLMAGCWWIAWAKHSNIRRGNAHWAPRRRSVRRPADRFRAETLLWFFCGKDYQALVAKDRRQVDARSGQWTQGRCFSACWRVYFLNLRNLNYHLLTPVWRNLIAFLNIFSLAAIMSSFCSRFVYPQMSLEGHGCWILGLSPVSIGRMLLVKFAAAWIVLLAVGAGLLILSSTLLNATPGVRALAAGLAAAMSAAFCALATGLGAIFMNLRQRNPVVILSGFGGTLNLALSLAYMIAAILPFAALYHWFYLERLDAQSLHRGLWAAGAWLAVLTSAATVVPLALARRSLLHREY